MATATLDVPNASLPRAASPPAPLTFDRHLRHAFTPVSERLEKGVECLDTFINILRTRIQAEADFVRSLQKIVTGSDWTSHETGTIKDGLEAIRSDVHNEYTARTEFCNSLNEDVYKPLLQIRELYTQNNRRFAQMTKNNIKQLRSSQGKWIKVKAKFDKVARDAEQARSALIDAKSDLSMSTSQVLKMGSKVNATMKSHQSMQEKFDSEKLLWQRQQIRFDDEMTSVLQGMQSNEAVRMQTVGDCVRKWAVFITNFCANRNYDIRSMADVMNLVNPDNDLQSYMRDILTQHPLVKETNPNPNDTETSRVQMMPTPDISITDSRRKSLSISRRRMSQSIDLSISDIHTQVTSISFDDPRKSVNSRSDSRTTPLSQTRGMGRTAPPHEHSVTNSASHQSKLSRIFKLKSKSERALLPINNRPPTPHPPEPSSSDNSFEAEQPTYMSMPTADNVTEPNGIKPNTSPLVFPALSNGISVSFSESYKDPEIPMPSLEGGPSMVRPHNTSQKGGGGVGLVPGLGLGLGLGLVPETLGGTLGLMPTVTASLNDMVFLEEGDENEEEDEQDDDDDLLSATIPSSSAREEKEHVITPPPPPPHILPLAPPAPISAIPAPPTSQAPAPPQSRSQSQSEDALDTTDDSTNGGGTNTVVTDTVGDTRLSDTTILCDMDDTKANDNDQKNNIAPISILRRSTQPLDAATTNDKHSNNDSNSGDNGKASTQRFRYRTRTPSVHNDAANGDFPNTTAAHRKASAESANDVAADPIPPTNEAEEQPAYPSTSLRGRHHSYSRREKNEREPEQTPPITPLNSASSGGD